MAGYSSPVSNSGPVQSNAITPIMDCNKINDDIFYEIFSRLVQLKNIHPLFLTSKRFHQILSNHTGLLGQIYPLYYLQSFKVNPNPSDIKILFEQLKAIDINIRAGKYLRQIIECDRKRVSKRVHSFLVQNGKVYHEYEAQRCAVKQDGFFCWGDTNGFLSIRECKTPHTFQAHDRLISAVIIVARKLISSSYDGSFKIWDLNNLDNDPQHSNNVKMLNSLTLHSNRPVNCLAFHNDTLFSGGDDGFIRTYDFKTADVGYFKGDQNHGNVLCMDAQDGILCCGASDCLVKVWEIETGKQLHGLQGHECSVSSVLIHDGKIFSGDRNGEIMGWDIRSGKKLFSCTAHSSAVKTLKMDNGKLYSCSGSSTIHVLDFNFLTPSSQG